MPKVVKEDTDFAACQKIVNSRYTVQTAQSIVGSVVSDCVPEMLSNTRPEVTVVPLDTLSALFKIPIARKVAVLNFASAHNPGGGILTGAKSQEEDLCRNSNLWNVLSDSRFEKHYATQMGMKYTDEFIYSPGIMFFNPLRERPADVITYAAPNLSHGEMSGYTVSMHKRIFNMFQLALFNQVDTLILGAWGCGVFRNDPATVANFFSDALVNSSSPPHVVFAIPGKKELKIFREVLL